jgi:hypothetical protein
MANNTARTKPPPPSHVMFRGWNAASMMM